MLFNLFTKKKKGNKKILNQIADTIFNLQQKIAIYEIERENEIEQIKDLIKRKENDAAKIRYRNVTNIDEVINNIYEKILMLKRRKLCLIEDEDTNQKKKIDNTINSIQNDIEFDDEFDKIINVEDSKDLSGVYSSFVNYDESEYNDLVNNIVND